MKTLRAILTELKKYTISLSFLICIGIAILLCFCSLFRITIDGSEQSVFDVMMSVSYEEKLADISLNCYSAFKAGHGEWFTLFIPVAAAFAFVPVVCDERSGGNIRLNISRIGKIRYCVAKATAAAVSAGLAIVIGYMIYGIVVFTTFPSPDMYCVEEQSFIYASLGTAPLLSVTGLLVRLFIYGAVSALPALLLSAIIRNKFLVICIPFMMKYIFAQVYVKLVMDIIFLDAELPPIVSVISPDSLLPEYSDAVQNVLVFAVYSAFIIICTVIYTIITVRRTDCGA